MSIFNSPQSEPPNRPSRRSKRLNKPKSKSKSYNNRKPKPIDNAELKDNNDNNDNNTNDSNNNNNSVSTSPISLSSSHSTSKRKSKIFNIFNSPKSEPPPLPSCERLAQATSLPTISTNTNKSRRKRNNKKHHRGSSENSGGSQFEKLKSIISGLFPKKSVSTKPRKKRKRKKLGRSRSFSIKKNNNDSNNNNNNNNNNNKNKNNKNKKNKMKKPKKKSKKSKKSRKSNSDFELDINNMNNNNNNNNKNKKRKKKERANSANNMLSIVNTAAWMDDFNEETERELEMQRELEKELEMKIEMELEDEESIEQESPFKSEIRKIKRDTMNSMIKKAVLDEITEVDEDVDFSLSETEEYKDDFHDVNGLPLATRPALAPKSSSCMRTFEKRPEYTTYYPPASLMEVFNNITVDDQERSVTLETKQGIKQRLDSVDQLFELATRGNMDYSAFYGHQNSNNFAAQELGLQSLSNKIMNSSSHSHSNTNNNFLNIDFNDNDYELNPITTTPTMDVSVLSSLPEYDDEYDENDEYRHCMAWE